MKLYLSELDIPELQHVPVREARRLWHSVLQRDSVAARVRVSVFLSLVILLAWVDLAPIWIGILFGVAFEVSTQIVIALKRPVIRELLKEMKKEEL